MALNLLDELLEGFLLDTVSPPGASAEDFLNAERDGLPPLSDFSPSAAEERNRIIRLLRVFERFTNLALKNGWVVRSHFFRLANALDDLNRCIVDPLLARREPEPGEGRKPDPTSVWILKADVCVAVEALCRGGLTAEKAATHVAGHHKWVGVLAGKKAKSIATAVLQWLRQFRAQTVKVEPAQERYRDGVLLVSEIPAASVRGWADRYLSQLRMSASHS